MSDSLRTIQIPRASPVNAYTMGNIAKQCGLSPDQFRHLLQNQVRFGERAAATDAKRRPGFQTSTRAQYATVKTKAPRGFPAGRFELIKLNEPASLLS